MNTEYGKLVDENLNHVERMLVAAEKLTWDIESIVSAAF